MYDSSTKERLCGFVNIACKPGEQLTHIQSETKKLKRNQTLVLNMRHTKKSPCIVYVILLFKWQP